MLSEIKDRDSYRCTLTAVGPVSAMPDVFMSRCA